MARMVELFEVSFDFNVLLFAEQSDASQLAGLLCKAAKASSAANPLNPQARVTLSPVEPRMRRVFVPVSEAVCLNNFGRRLKAARPCLLEETGKVIEA